MTMKIRTEFASKPTFELSNKLGFTTSNVTDPSIKRSMTQLNTLAQAGRLMYIPASATTEQLSEAVPCIVGQEESEAVVAAKAAGKLVYHVVPTYMRVFEASDGATRTGTQTAQFDGFDNIAGTDYI